MRPAQILFSGVSSLYPPYFPFRYRIMEEEKLFFGDVDIRHYWYFENHQAVWGIQSLEKKEMPDGWPKLNTLELPIEAGTGFYKAKAMFRFIGNRLIISGDERRNVTVGFLMQIQEAGKNLFKEGSEGNKVVYENESAFPAQMIQGTVLPGNNGVFVVKNCGGSLTITEEDGSETKIEYNNAHTSLSRANKKLNDPEEVTISVKGRLDDFIGTVKEVLLRFLTGSPTA